MLGLNDYVIGHLDMNGRPGNPGHEKYSSEYVFEQKPDILYVYFPADIHSIDELKQWAQTGTASWSAHWAMLDLVDNPRLGGLYRVGSLDDGHGEIRFLYRRDIPPTEIFNQQGLSWLTSGQ